MCNSETGENKDGATFGANWPKPSTPPSQSPSSAAFYQGRESQEYSSPVPSAIEKEPGNAI